MVEVWLLVLLAGVIVVFAAVRGHQSNVREVNRQFQRRRDLQLQKENWEKALQNARGREHALLKGPPSRNRASLVNTLSPRTRSNGRIIRRRDEDDTAAILAGALVGVALGSLNKDSNHDEPDRPVGGGGSFGGGGASGSWDAGSSSSNDFSSVESGSSSSSDPSN